MPTAISIVNRHTLSLDAFRHVKVIATSYTVAHAKGHLLTSYPWAVGLFAIPAVVVLDLLHIVGGPSADAVPGLEDQDSRSNGFKIASCRQPREPGSHDDDIELFGFD